MDNSIREERIAHKWKMIDRNNFTAQYDGYDIRVQVPFWFIMKREDAVVIDSCFYHPNIATGELQTKVQAERALTKLLTLKPNPNE